MIHVDPLVRQGLLLGGALLFGFAALHKLREPAAFREALGDYALLPRRAVAPLARLTPLVELALALALAGGLPWSGAAGAALLSLYSGAIAINLLRGRRGIDCGCGGAGGPRPLGVSLLVRNGAVAGALLLASAPATPRALGELDLVLLALGTTTLVLLYAAVDLALANSARLGSSRGGRPARLGFEPADPATLHPAEGS